MDIWKTWLHPDRLRIDRAAIPTASVLVRNSSGAAARSLCLANDAVKATTTSATATTTTAAATTAEGGTGTGSRRSSASSARPVPVVLLYVDERAIIEDDMATLRTLVEAYYPLCNIMKRSRSLMPVLRTSSSSQSGNPTSR
ncbi:hypothetical protein BJ912DRAFT_952064 [Pholiota molesta]|nr:hypothetical protein BJ912DRAFT_952064 [Pholiota molesta]